MYIAILQKVQTRNCLDGSKHASELVIAGLIDTICSYIEGVVVVVLLHQIACLLINHVLRGEVAKKTKNIKVKRNQMKSRNK